MAIAVSGILIVLRPAVVYIYYTLLLYVLYARYSSKHFSNIVLSKANKNLMR